MERKENSNVYKQTVRTLELSEAYVSRDAERFHMLLQRAGRRFRKQKLLTARGLFLEQKYEQAAVCLQSYKGENTYHEVLRQYLLGKCLHKMENKKWQKNVWSMCPCMGIRCRVKRKRRSGC